LDATLRVEGSEEKEQEEVPHFAVRISPTAAAGSLMTVVSAVWGCPFPRNRTKPDETERLLSSNVLQKRIK